MVMGNNCLNNDRGDVLLAARSVTAQKVHFETPVSLSARLDGIVNDGGWIALNRAGPVQKRCASIDNDATFDSPLNPKDSFTPDVHGAPDNAGEDGLRAATYVE